MSLSAARRGARNKRFRFAAPYVAGGNVSYHNGSDIAAPTGTPVLATNAGRVLVADFFPIKGGFVLIDHGAGLYSYYLHNPSCMLLLVNSCSRPSYR